MRSQIVNKLNLVKTDQFARGTFLNFVARGAIIGLNLLLIPLLIKALGTEKFGIWQTVLSLISMVSLLNFGLGNGLRNLVTKLFAQDKLSEIGAAIGATMKTTGKIISAAIFILIPAIIFLFNPEHFFADNNIPSTEITISLVIFTVFFLLNIGLGISNSIAYGFQKSYLTGVVQTIYLLSCYVCLFTLTIFKSITLIDVAIIFGGLQSLCYLGFFVFQVRKFNLNIDLNNKYSLKNTYRLSGNFFLVQVLALIFLSIDNFVISSQLGAAQTAEFSIVNRLFFTLISVFSILLIQFWNSVTEAKEREQLEWIKKTLKFLFLAAGVTFIAGLLISFFQEEILSLWLGQNFSSIASSTFYLFSIYTFLHCLNAVFINLQNGLGELRIQIISVLVALLIYVLGIFIVDAHTYGYNYLIILKIAGTFVAIIINSFVLKRII